MHQESHLVAGDTQRVDIMTLAQTGNCLVKSLLRLSCTLQRDQCCTPLCLTHRHLILATQQLLHLVSLRGIVERAFLLLQVVIHLRSHPMEHCQPLWVVCFLSIADGFQNVFLRFLRLAHRHIDTSQRVQRRSDIIGITRLHVDGITAFGILCRLFEMPQAHVDQRQQTGTVGHI